MSGRIAKPSSRKVQQRNSLLRGILSRSSTMPTCSSCLISKAECVASELDSTRCFECVRRQKPHCDMHGLTPEQMSRVARRHLLAESALDAALDEFETVSAKAREIHEKASEEVEKSAAKVRRLRHQRQLWADKLSRAISRGLASVEELEELERQEASEAAAQQSSVQQVLAQQASPAEFVASASDWEAFLRSDLPDVAWPNLPAEPDPSDAQGSSSSK